MGNFLALALAMLVALMVIGWLADRRARAGNPHVTPGLRLLPGDFKYESPSGNVRVFFPVATAVVASILVSLVLWLIG